MPNSVSPDAVTMKVISAASRSLGCCIAWVSPEPIEPSRASAAMDAPARPEGREQRRQRRTEDTGDAVEHAAPGCCGVAFVWVGCAPGRRRSPW